MRSINGFSLFLYTVYFRTCVDKYRRNKYDRFFTFLGLQVVDDLPTMLYVTVSETVIFPYFNEYVRCYTHLEFLKHKSLSPVPVFWCITC